MGNLILVIDDSNPICEVIKVSLQREGHEVVCVSSGETALRWLASREARVPDLIFVDLCLPAMDGYSVIQRLRTQPIFQPLPIVILSRLDGILPHLKARLVGANDYIVKPFKTEDLFSVVQKHFRLPLVGAAS